MAFGRSLLFIGTAFFHKLSEWCIWKSYLYVTHFMCVPKGVRSIGLNATGPCHAALMLQRAGRLFSQNIQQAYELQEGLFYTRPR